MKKLLLLSALILYTNIVLGLTGDGLTRNTGYFGRLTVDATFGPGTVYIRGNIYTDTLILTIAPMTTLIIRDGISIKVEEGGSLNADGDNNNKIIFTADNIGWGHIWLDKSPGSVLDNCIFQHGTVPENEGGALYAVNSSLQISNCLFINNSAQDGGALALWDSDAEITNCVFENNNATAGGRGGAIFIHSVGHTPIIDRCKIYLNHSEDRTGGVHFDTDPAGIITNSLIYNNSSVNAGGGVSMGTNDLNPGRLVSITNCVIANNTPCDVTFRTSLGFSVQNSVIWGSDKSVWYITGHGGGAPEESNLINCAVQGALDRDGTTQLDIESTFDNSFKLNSLNEAVNGPNFYDPATYDYRIKLISPCRDKGLSTGDPLPPATDFSGNGRIGAYDVGSYEVQYRGWTGAVNDEWGTAGNWNPGFVPVSGTETILIPSGLATYPTGLLDQNFTIGTSNEMSIEPGAQVTLHELVNNGTLYLCSNQNAIASLIVNSYDNSGGGKENIQLYLTGGGSVLTWPWHYISSPVSTLSTDVFTEGPIHSLDLAAYYEDYTGVDYNSRWRAWDGWDYSILPDGGYPGTRVTFDALEPGKGYNIYFYETEGVTKSFGGSLNTDDEFEDLSYSEGNNSTQGWNLVGNPFSSGLDWSSCIRSASVDNAIYFTSNNSFATYVNGVGLPEGTDGLIPPMQGFFVKANATGQTVELPLNARVHTFHSRYKGEAEEIPLIRLKIEGLKASDETVIRFDDKAKTGFDSEFDAYKFSKTGSYVSLWTTLGSISYAINSIPFPETSTEVPVGINTYEQGTYKITVSQLQELSNYNVYLTDKSSGFTLNLKITPSMIFKASAGKTEDRFVIRVIKNSGTGEDPYFAKSKFRIFTSFDMVNIQTLSDEWDGRYGSASLIDMAGRTISQTDNTEFLKSSLLQIPAGGNKGVYIVKLQSGTLVYTGKIILR